MPLIGVICMSRLQWCLGAAVAVSLCGGASAGTSHSTSYSYYPVNGRTPADIYRAILSRGPEVNGAKALASTSATTRQNGRLVQGPTCQVVDYGLDLNFVIRLPRLRNEAVLPRAERRLWRQFSAFLRAHEEHHRELWLGCAAEMDRKVRALKVKSCKQASKRVNELWQRMLTSCGKKQTAFDEDERKTLMQQPFMRAAVRGLAGD